MPANGSRLETLAESCDERSALRDRLLNRGQCQRCLMQRSTFPYLSDPNGVAIGGVCCDDVAQTAGHTCRVVQQDLGQGIALPDRLELPISPYISPFPPEYSTDSPDGSCTSKGGLLAHATFDRPFDSSNAAQCR